MRTAMVWALFANTIPLFSLSPLLFEDTGLSAVQISALFAIWSTVSVVCEVPAGVVADRISRRGAIIMGGLLQGAGYVLWTTVPSFEFFAAGFALWAIGGALVSGSLEALVYDSLTVSGDTERYVGVMSRVAAVEMFAQLPAAVAATLLFTAGGYVLVGWVSVAACVAAACVAAFLPESRPSRSSEPGPLERPSYLGILRAGVRIAMTSTRARTAVLVVGLFTGLDGVDEYVPLMARGWGLSTGAVPLVVLLIPLAGGIGAVASGRSGRLGPVGLVALLFGAVGALALAVTSPPAFGMAGVAMFYGLYRLLQLIADAHLQDAVPSETRATVRSVANFGGEAVTLGIYAAWAVGQVGALVGYVALVTLIIAPLMSRSARYQRTDSPRWVVEINGSTAR